MKTYLEMKAENEKADYEYEMQKLKQAECDMAFNQISIIMQINSMNLLGILYQGLNPNLFVKGK